MKPTLLLFYFIFIGQIVSAQFIFKPEYITIVPYPFEEGNTVVLQALNPLPEMHFYHNNVEYEVGDTISNFAFTDAIKCVYFSDTLISIMSPYQDFEINSFQPASNLNSHDGELNLHFNYNQVFPANTFEIIYLSNGAYGASPTSIDSVNFNFNEMVPSKFTINGSPNAYLVDDQLAYRQFEIGGIMFDQSMNYFALSGFSVNVLSVSDQLNSCDGGAIVEPINATGSVTYTWDGDQMLTGNYQNQLCPGVHYVSAKDVATNYSALKQFVITDSSQNFYDASVSGSNDDTLDLIYLNCYLDYNSAIDSINMDITFLNESNDTIYNLLNLEIYQGSNNVQINDTIITPGYGVYYYSIAIYCNSLKSSVFNGKKIFSVNNATNLGVSDFKKTDVQIYPNPSNSIVHFTKGGQSGQVKDLNMKLIHSFDNVNFLEISSLDNGVYFIILKESNSILKLIKY